MTIGIAMLLVVGVVYLFLQSWRATIIPVIAIPVSLVGAFSILAVFGISINNLSLFGLVLAVGIVVDDAIVVAENVERNMAQSMSSREAASEGLSALVIDCRAFGGQAGASARIENYLGFPTGITGVALMARAYNQAQKFGAEMAIPDEVCRLEEQRVTDRACLALTFINEERVHARAVIIASGARYRRLDVHNLAAFEGSSVHYWASPLEAQLCAGQQIALVGAGNSAGQAAVYLADRVAKVWMIVRGTGPGATMSRYLVERIAARRTSKSCTAHRSRHSTERMVSWKRSVAAPTAQA